MNLSFKQYINEAKVVGKVIGGDRYLHKSYEHLLPHDELSAAKKHLPSDHEYHVVKHNKKDGSFSFIHSHDFDTNPEPTVGDAIKVHADGHTTVTKAKKDPQIYHGKEDFVDKDYKGFDTSAAKIRSDKYRSWIRDNGGKEISSRMGTLSKWKSMVVEPMGLQ